MNWANRFTVFRIILVPVFIAAILYARLELALAVFILASVTDALDGYVARAFNQKTPLGTVMDPIADKLLILSAFVSFSMVKGLPVYLKMPVYVPIAVISRDVIILLGSAVVYIVKGDLEVKPTALGKLTTCFQMLTIIALLLKFVHSSWLWNATVLLTVASGLDYIRIGGRQINNL